ncbi:SIR2 family protein [Brucella intermedia]|uniref:SIR2 family protein n=1 Tax=Brucella intermedia TaxID=94625 RepID=UPI0018AAA6C5|nr:MULTISPECIES: SIR2 family protein [Brucella/Ochrobactrum group]WGG61442.1 SIR2 family protein [Brucella intermedia]
MAEFPIEFDPSVSILFLGAGFSRDAININGEKVPIGTGLETAIKDLTGIPRADTSSLADLSAYALDNQFDLYNLLRRSFTIRTISSSQKSILSRKWLRIYTTNYDDTISSHNLSLPNHERRAIYALDDEVPRQLRQNSAVYLHGYVHHLSADSVGEQLVLTHKSYAQQRAIKSPWWNRFSRDLQIAENIFFVGYEIGDFETASYLSTNPQTTKKSHFILVPSASPVISSRIKLYGQRHDFGVDGFAEYCNNAKSKPRPTHANQLRSFRFVDVTGDDKISPPPTPQEIFALYAFGSFEEKYLFSSFPNSTYSLIRTKRIEEAKRVLGEARTLLIHSKVGNGKTIFLKTLSLALAIEGYVCLELKEGVGPSAEEIDFLKNLEKVVIIFPSYDAAYANLDRFSELKESARFLVEINSSTLEVRYNETEERLFSPVRRVDLNRLERSEIDSIHALLRRAGITIEQIDPVYRDELDFRDVVLSIFENRKVLSRIDKLIKPILANSESKLVIACSALLKALGLNTDSGMLRSIANVDAYSVLHKSGENAYEFVKFNYDTIEPHSSLFSLFILRHYFQPHEVSGPIFHMAVEAARRMRESADPQSERVRIARQMLGGLLRFSFLEQIFTDPATRRAQVKLIYENARDNMQVQDEPLFWLQYSIFMQNQNNWPLAEEHMKTAYDRGSTRPGFKTYQLDTNYLGLCVELEMREAPDAPVQRLEILLGLLEKARDMINDGNHRGHTLKVLSRFEQFLAKRHKGLRKNERVRLTYLLNLLIQDLERLSPDIRAIYGSDPTKNSLSRAVRFLLS